MEFIDRQRVLIEAELLKHTENGKAITSGNLFALLSKDPAFAEMDQTAFQPKLSKAIRAGEIAGYEGRRKAGYIRAGTGSAPAPKRVEVQPEEEKVIAVAVGLRLRYLEGNWSIEKKIIVGEAASPIKAKEENIGQERWQPVPAYYGRLDQALEALMTRHIDLLGVPQVTEVKAADLKELLTAIREGIATVKRAVNDSLRANLNA